MERQDNKREFDSGETQVNSLRRGLILALVLVSVALTVHEIFGENGWLALRRQRRQVQTIEHRLQDIKQQNAQLQKDIRGLKSDPRTIERYAREQMHFARPGEIIYTFPPKKPAGGQPSTTAGDGRTKK